MREVWLHPNRRPLLIGFVFATLPLLAAIVLAFVPAISSSIRWTLIGMSLAAGMAALGLLFVFWRRPRMAYEQGELLVYLEGIEPARLPIDAVECFFPGQGSGMVRSATGDDTEVRTIIVKLADSAKEWHHRDVEAALGHWCDGYITIRGTWCEPISPELMKRLNHRLVEAHRACKNAAAGSAT